MSSIVRKVICTAAAGQPLGPYNQAVVVDKIMYISGQLGIDASSGDLVSGGVEQEADQSLKNMQTILQAAGGDMGNVVKTTILLADIKDWPKVNTIYEKYFKIPYPARAAYQVAALPKNSRVEIEAIAVLGDIKDE